MVIIQLSLLFFFLIKQWKQSHWLTDNHHLIKQSFVLQVRIRNTLIPEGQFCKREGENSSLHLTHPF